MNFNPLAPVDRHKGRLSISNAIRKIQGSLERLSPTLQRSSRIRSWRKIDDSCVPGCSTWIPLRAPSYVVWSDEVDEFSGSKLDVGSCSCRQVTDQRGSGGKSIEVAVSRLLLKNRLCKSGDARIVSENKHLGDVRQFQLSGNFLGAAVIQRVQEPNFSGLWKRLGHSCPCLPCSFRRRAKHDLRDISPLRQPCANSTRSVSAALGQWTVMVVQSRIVPARFRVPYKDQSHCQASLQSQLRTKCQGVSAWNFSLGKAWRFDFGVDASIKLTIHSIARRSSATPASIAEVTLSG